MTNKQIKEYIENIRQYLVDLEACVYGHCANMDGAEVAKSCCLWQELHAKNGLVDNLTADVK